jgi:CheY-like chemotaxis protein
VTGSPGVDPPAPGSASDFFGGPYRTGKIAVTIAQPATVAHVNAYMADTDPARRHVLLLEDDADLSLATETLLRAVGFSIHCENNAANGRRFFERSIPDVVVTDIGLMEGEDGLSFLRWAKTRARQATRRLYAIVISGHPDFRTGRGAIEAGADRFYSKPFDPVALVDELVAATNSTPIGPHLTRAFVDGTRLQTIERHIVSS